MVAAGREHTAADDAHVQAAVEAFRALSDATRLRLVLELEQQAELSVAELAARVGRSPAAVSQHLARLRGSRMVRRRSVGLRTLYRLSDEHPADLAQAAMQYAARYLDATAEHGAIEPNLIDRPSTKES